MRDILRLVSRELLTRTEIPLPKNRVILLDKDETLLSRQYQLTDSNIRGAIEGLQRQGWTVGLSSDAALQILQPLSQQLGLNGPIIAERGAIIHTADGRTLMNSQDTKAIAKSREAMVERLGEMGIPVILNTDARLKDKGMQWGNSGDVVVVLNALRKCSIALNIKRIQPDGSFGFDEEATNTVVNEMKPFYPGFSILFEDVNHDYGVLILSNGAIDKRSGTKLYMKDGALEQIGMVGNTESDFLGNDIAVHYTVGNATDAFKRRADFVAKGQLTTGVIEILSKIQRADSQRKRRRNTK